MLRPCHADCCHNIGRCVVNHWMPIACVHESVADTGFVKRGGRESKFPASPPGLKKSLSGGGGGGGDSDTFFPRNFLGRHLHYWVGVPSAYQTDLRDGKQKKKKKKKSPNKLKSSERRGGGAAADSPPPPWIRHRINVMSRESFWRWSR